MSGQGNAELWDFGGRYLPIRELGTVTSRPRIQELCESRGGRPGLSVPMSLTVSVNVKQH